MFDVRRATALSLRAVLMGILFSALGCQGSVEKKLSEVLAEAADGVAIGETEITASCKSGAVAKAKTEALELDTFGMTTPQNLTKVAQSLLSQCNAEEKKAKRHDAQGGRIAEEAKKRRLKVQGKTDDEVKAMVCAALAKELPLRGDKRDDRIRDNATLFGCEDPGPAKVPKTGYWDLDITGSHKHPKKVYLRLEANGDDVTDRLTLRCLKRGHPEMYVNTVGRVSRRNKTVSVKIGRRTKNWPVKLAKDRKAFFFKDPKKRILTLAGAKKATIKFKDARNKRRSLTFDTIGTSRAIAPLRKMCGF